MMQPDVFLMAMAFGAVIALLISWPFWLWRMDRMQDRTIEWVNEQFDQAHEDQDR